MHLTLRKTWRRTNELCLIQNIPAMQLTNIRKFQIEEIAIFSSLISWISFRMRYISRNTLCFRIYPYV